MRLYWQSKIFALLHDPIFKPFQIDKSGQSCWRDLAVMADWEAVRYGKLLQYLKNADYISAASDWGAIGNGSEPVNSGAAGVEISHLLSGAKQYIQPVSGDDKELIDREQKLFPDCIKQETDPRKVFWWLWRCLPTAACMNANDTSVLLMPADTRIPDTSLWSHTSMTAALAGASIGYDATIEDFEKTHSAKSTCLYEYYAHPHLVSFSFAPVQDLIKSSRKMRDFWAGSWILHYLSAKISWKLAQKYGPDTLLYPSLFHQPLIDLWLLHPDKYPDFKDWIRQPLSSSLLTAGFPNVLVLVLPEGEVKTAMQIATQELKETWRDLGDRVFDELKEHHWPRGLLPKDNSWQGWLDAQWQIYWTGIPIGNPGEHFRQANNDYFASWVTDLNKVYGLVDPLPTDEQKTLRNSGLFTNKELSFLSKYDANIGSWWGYIFDTTRLTANSVKNARNWQLPTIFSTRSTISGLGAAVHNQQTDWAKEGEVKQFWQDRSGLFDGREQLNASEVIKRGLHKVLAKLFGGDELNPDKLAIAYPDLTAGVAGYLNTSDDKARKYYLASCQEILAEYELDRDRDDYKWGIPWAEKDVELKGYHPRLLNAGWLVEDLGIPTDEPQQLLACRDRLNGTIDRFYPGNNPTDWYVLAAGDGDGMSEWLKGLNLAPYSEYIASELPRSDRLQEFLTATKRMGPATHNALSRALLDFSNQLVPYLTETRYAGRLIYAGGDDVLAYTNLWEWDSWLWDIRQCFRGDLDPHGDFKNSGDYWQWRDKNNSPKQITPRPLFTMGNTATISFGIVIAHQSVPLAIALENLWAAEASAKEHQSIDKIPQGEAKSKYKKDAVQIRVMYQNGNVLSATAKFQVFKSWRELLNTTKELNLDAALFEQANTLWLQHPAPLNATAIDLWCQAFCERRDALDNDGNTKFKFQTALINFLKNLSENTTTDRIDLELGNWLKLAAFTLRRREIKLGENL